MKKKEKSAPAQPMDERQSQITQKAIVYAFVFLIICLFAATIYQIATTGDVGWELFGIIGASAVILISRRLLGDVEQPLDYKNRPLPTGASKAEKMVRCKNYAVGSAWFGLAFAVMDVLLIAFGENEVTDYELAELIFPDLGKGATIAVTAVIAFGTMFLVSFVFDAIIGEWKVKRYNQLMEQLDAEESD